MSWPFVMNSVGETTLPRYHSVWNEFFKIMGDQAPVTYQNVMSYLQQLHATRPKLTKGGVRPKLSALQLLRQVQGFPPFAHGTFANPSKSFRANNKTATHYIFPSIADIPPVPVKLSTPDEIFRFAWHCQFWLDLRAIAMRSLSGHTIRRLKTSCSHAHYQVTVKDKRPKGAGFFQRKFHLPLQLNYLVPLLKSLDQFPFQHLSNGHYNDLLEGALKQHAHLAQMTSHANRHGRTSQLYASGEDVAEIRLLTGWVDDFTAYTYIHPIPEWHPPQPSLPKLYECKHMLSAPVAAPGDIQESKPHKPAKDNKFLSKVFKFGKCRKGT